MVERLWKKSKLQKSLESLGWKWLTNLSLEEGESRKYLNDLKVKKRFSEIRIESAYDCYGILIPNMQAIYANDSQRACA